MHIVDDSCSFRRSHAIFGTLSVCILNTKMLKKGSEFFNKINKIRSSNFCLFLLNRPLYKICWWICNFIHTCARKIMKISYFLLPIFIDFAIFVCLTDKSALFNDYDVQNSRQKFHSSSVCLWKFFVISNSRVNF